MNHAWWSRGLTLNGFVKSLGEDGADLRRRLGDVRLAPIDSLFFTLCTEPVYVIAMTEGWCSNTLMNLPILASIVDAAPSFEMRIFVRSQSPELAAAYAESGITNIPVFSFFDADFHEIGTWAECPRAAREYLSRWRAENPAYDTIRADATLAPEEKTARLQPLVRQLGAAMEDWYARDLQTATAAELAVLLGGAGCSFGCQGSTADEYVDEGTGV